MDKPALELKKLQAELAKLQAETDEIKLRVTDRPSTRQLEKWTVYPAYIGLVTTLLVIGIQWGQYLNQIKEQHRFNVDTQLITLVAQLVDPKDPTMQRSAAMQLALFGSPAGPVLLESLDFEITAPVVEAISRALVEIGRNEDDASWLLTRIIESTSQFINRQLEKKHPIVPTIRRHLIALVAVANDLLADLTPAESVKPKQKVIQTLIELRMKIDSRFTDSDQDSKLLAVIDDGIRRLEL